ncbi:MAG: hypothetical protein GY906_13285 [bacterium]|nr:hypothetical protein [bacterium]
MTIESTIFDFDTLFLALLLGGALYAYLKHAVPVPPDAAQALEAGLEMAKQKDDQDYAMVGAVMAARAWGRRKRWLLALSLILGIVASITLVSFVPSVASAPLWLGVSAAIAGMLLFVKSPN